MTRSLVAGVVAWCVVAVAIAPLLAAWIRGRRTVRTCRVCGCTDDAACMPFGCWWIGADLCSSHQIEHAR